MRTIHLGRFHSTAFSFPWGLLIAALIATGCATKGHPVVVNQEQVSQLQIGKSSQETVRSTLGEPQHVTKRIDSAGQVSESWGYGYSSVASEAATFLLWDSSMERALLKSSGLDITFTADGIVSRITRQNQRAESGPGAKPSPGTVVISR